MRMTKNPRSETKSLSEEEFAGLKGQFSALEGKIVVFIDEIEMGNPFPAPRPAFRPFSEWRK